VGGAARLPKGENAFPDVSTVAIRLLASQSTQGAYKFGVLATRKLPVWNGSAFELQASRNNGWAFFDAVTNPQYGSGVPISKADFNSVVNFAAGCDARGDTFDYAFDSAVAVPDAFDKILTPARARHFWLGDTVSLVRDEWRDVPTMMLTDREIVRNSTQIGFTMLGEEDPDAVIVEYVDEQTWRPAQVQYPPNAFDFVAANAEVKRIDGVVNRSQAFRECAFYYLQSVYRRQTVQIATEYEGRAITFGAVLRVQSELPMAYGYGGAVVDVSGHALTLSPAPTWDTGPFYIRLRRPNGTFFGPVLVTEGESPAIANLDADSLAGAEAAQSTTLAAVLAREDGGEAASFELGTGVSSSRPSTSRSRVRSPL
jgi:predicted phage tail protein